MVDRPRYQLGRGLRGHGRTGYEGRVPAPVETLKRAVRAATTRRRGRTLSLVTPVVGAYAAIYVSVHVSFSVTGQWSGCTGVDSDGCEGLRAPQARAPSQSGHRTARPDMTSVPAIKRD